MSILIEKLTIGYSIYRTINGQQHNETFTLNSREMQIKTKMGQHFPLIKLIKIKMNDDILFWKACERETSSRIPLGAQKISRPFLERSVEIYVIYRCLYTCICVCVCLCMYLHICMMIFYPWEFIPILQPYFFKVFDYKHVHCTVTLIASIKKKDAKNPNIEISDKIISQNTAHLLKMM